LHERARAAARAAGAWEGLLLDERGELAEGSVTNLFAVRGGTLVTSGLESGGLAGIARAALLGDLEREPLRAAGGRTVAVEVRSLAPAELCAADEVFLTNALQGVVPVVEILGPGRARALPGSQGALTRALRTRFERLERERSWSIELPG
jgi:branched-subunit amino acid aminotransferase/4-amino-4-deoxychorismate lyase